MKTAILLMALMGVALTEPSFSHEKETPQHHKGSQPAEAAGGEGKNGHPPDVTKAYERFITLAAEVEADESLSEEEKKRRLSSIHHQLTKMIQGVTGVPKELIGSKLPHPGAEAHRQEFLREIDNTLKSTSMSHEEKKAAIGEARAQFRQSLDHVKGAMKNGGNQQTHKQMEKALQSRARADVMSKMKEVMNDPTITQEERKQRFNQEMKKEIHRLQQQYRRQGSPSQKPAQGHPLAHHKKTKAPSKK